VPKKLRFRVTVSAVSVMVRNVLRCRQGQGSRLRLGLGSVMLTRSAGHEAKAEAEPRHVREQLSVYEHEDYDIGVQNIVFSKQPIHNRNDCR